MPFIRLSDEYVESPKIRPLTDGAFRLWHFLLAYTRRHQTDGVISLRTVKEFTCYRASRLQELAAIQPDCLNPLIRIEPDRVILHNYLQWNLSREEERKRRDESTERQKRWRDKQSIRARNASTDALVLGRDIGEGTDLPEGESEGKPSPAAIRYRRIEPRRFGRGVMAGALPADHLDHAICSPNLSWCVPNAVHTRLVTALAPQHQGDREKAHLRLLAWYPTVFQSLAADTVIADDFKFWRGKLSAAFSRPTDTKPEPSGRVVPGVEETQRLLASLRD